MSFTGNIPSPPYTFNDIRLTYNEPCFFYNGGFSLTCLVTRHPRGTGGVVGKFTQKSYPSKDMIDLIFKVCIDYVNDKDYKEEEYCEIKRYSFPKENLVSVKTSQMNVKRKILKITSGDFDVRVINKFLSSSNPIVNKDKTKTTVSSSLEKLKTYVSSSLHFNNPKKIKIKSKIVKNKEEK